MLNQTKVDKNFDMFKKFFFFVFFFKSIYSPEGDPMMDVTYVN